MVPESYENEPKESIERCLNCELPAYKCFGKGNCIHEKKKRRRGNGQLEQSVLSLQRDGMKCYRIAKELEVSSNTVRTTLIRLYDKGVLTLDELKKAGIYTNND